MKKDITVTDQAPAAIGPYSQAIRVGDFLFASGQIALDPKSGELTGQTIEEQTRRCCENVRGILSANNMDFSNVIKTTCFLADMNDFAAFNAIYGEYFVTKPARSCVAVKEIPKGALCEIEIIAAVG